MNNLLPIGTVVKIGSVENYLVMVMGYYPKNEEEDKYYHYIGCLYPFGIRNRESFVLFNEASISEIIFQGYQDEAGEKLSKGLPILMNEMFNGTQNSVEA